MAHRPKAHRAPAPGGVALDTPAATLPHIAAVMDSGGQIMLGTVKPLAGAAVEMCIRDRFTKKPLRFFGMIGVAAFTLGALALLYLVFERLYFQNPLADRPALLLASLLIVLGVQIFALGLLGELIIFAHAGGNKDYQVDRIIQFPERSAP